METDVLGPANGHAGDAGDLLEAEVGKRLAGLALRARLKVATRGGVKSQQASSLTHERRPLHPMIE